MRSRKNTIAPRSTIWTGLFLSATIALPVAAGSAESSAPNWVSDQTVRQAGNGAVLDTKPTPPKPKKVVYHRPAPEKLQIDQGLNPLALVGPIGIYYGTDPEQTKGGWAAQTIQSITNLSPSKSELARFADSNDWTAGEALQDDTIASPLRATWVKSSSARLDFHGRVCDRAGADLWFK
jgi:hypothetical protein